MSQLSLEKAPFCLNDWLPRSTRGFVAFNLLLVLGFKLAGYALATDKSVVFSSHDWIYHSMWLPLHLMLARCASGIFARHVEAARQEIIPALRPEFIRRVDIVTSKRGMLGALVLVAPLALLDMQAGVAFVHQNFATQGRAGALIPIIWMIEWLATAQIWLYVLGSIYITPIVFHAENLRGRHVAVLIHGQSRGSIKSGLEHALVILLYGISTVGYVWFADGQLSDYLVLVISTLLVLVCFFSALVQLRANLRHNLDEREQELLQSVPGAALLARPAAPAALPSCPGPSRDVAYQFLADSTEAVYGKRLIADRVVEARIRLLRLATCMPLNGRDETVARSLADEVRILIECEVRLHELGVGEIRTMSVRTGMPIIAIAGKSLGGVIGLH